MCNESVALHLLRPHDTLVAQARRTPRPWTQLGRPAPAQDPCPTPRNPRSDPSVTHIDASRPKIQSAASPQDAHEAPTSANVAHAYTCRSVPLTHSSQRRQAQRGEFWVNDPSKVFVARGGTAELTNTILTADEVRDLVERMLKSSGRRVDLSSPFVDATLPDGSRLHVVIPDITGSACGCPHAQKF